jgi:hypothetical protein
MTRDQAKQIAEAIFDSAEREGHLSKDLVADAIFNSWHKQTANVRPTAYYVSSEACLNLACTLATYHIQTDPNATL